MNATIHMKPVVRLATAAALALAIVAPVHSQQPKAAGKPGVELGEVMVVTAKVVGIDRADRAVALQGPEGNVVVLEVSKAVKNFNQIKVGDQVKLEYYDAVAIYVGAAGELPAAEASTLVGTAPKGKMPGGVILEVVDISATIQAIDKAKRTLTLKGPQGHTFPVKVDKSVKAFDQLKVGDSIHVRHTEAVAISVSKP